MEAYKGYELNLRRVTATEQKVRRRAGFIAYACWAEEDPPNCRDSKGHCAEEEYLSRYAACPDQPKGERKARATAISRLKGAIDKHIKECH